MTFVLSGRRNLILDGEHLEQRFIDRGFVDVKVIQKDIIIGEWRSSIVICQFFSPLDSRSAAYGRAARGVWIGALTAMIEHLTEFYPDKAKRREMADKVEADLNNPDYHFFCPMYWTAVTS